MLLDEDDVEAIAQRVAQIVRPEPLPGLVSADVVSARFGVSRTWVYAHADELGVIRLGDGPRARLRFDLRRCAERFAQPTPEPVRAPAPRRAGRRIPVRLPAGVELIEGRSARR